MQLSAEVRWFGLGPVPDDLKGWFQEPASAFRYPAGGGRSRTDVYLPADRFEPCVGVGDMVRGGETVIARVR